MLLEGIEWSDSPKPYRIATVEKALLDTFYIATRKKRRFAKLPELDLNGAGFKKQRYRALIATLNLPPPIAGAMRARFDDVMSVPGLK